jgi:hypothetical protein
MHYNKSSFKILGDDRK